MKGMASGAVYSAVWYKRNRGSGAALGSIGTLAGAVFAKVKILYVETWI
jgi:hypothetical protein